MLTVSSSQTSSYSTVPFRQVSAQADSSRPEAPRPIDSVSLGPVFTPAEEIETALEHLDWESPEEREQAAGRIRSALASVDPVESSRLLESSLDPLNAYLDDPTVAPEARLEALLDFADILNPEALAQVGDIVKEAPHDSETLGAALDVATAAFEHHQEPWMRDHAAGVVLSFPKSSLALIANDQIPGYDLEHLAQFVERQPELFDNLLDRLDGEQAEYLRARGLRSPDEVVTDEDAKAVFDFVVGDTVRDGYAVYQDLSRGDYRGAAGQAIITASGIVPLGKAGKLLDRGVDAVLDNGLTRQLMEQWHGLAETGPRLVLDGPVDPLATNVVERRRKRDRGGSLPSSHGSPQGPRNDRFENPLDRPVEQTTNYPYRKHVPPRGASKDEIIRATRGGKPARYFSRDRSTIFRWEREAWENGEPVRHANKPWKVYEHPEEVGANNGQATRYMRVESTPDGTIHGHPVTREWYDYYLGRGPKPN